MSKAAPETPSSCCQEDVQEARGGRSEGGKSAQDGAELRQDSTEVERGRKGMLLAGGNPQIPKGYGDAPVQAYIAAMPGWKQEVGRRLDALIVRTVPGVLKAVKWNSPFPEVRARAGSSASIA